jgi:hypothetical protein
MSRRLILVLFAAASLTASACGASAPLASTGAGSFSPATSAAGASSPAVTPSASSAPVVAASPASSVAASTGLKIVRVDLKADPATITSVCPIKIRFLGQITATGGAGVVSYKWVSSDGDVSPVDTVTFTGPGSMDVSSDWTLDDAVVPSRQGWSSIEIVSAAGSPSSAVSPHASFDFTCDQDGFETIGFGIGGSDATCSLATTAQSFATTDKVRMVADYSPDLQNGTIVTFTLSRDGVVVTGYPKTITLDKATKCLHGNVSPGVLPAGHYRLDIKPDTSRPISGEFDTK